MKVKANNKTYDVMEFTNTKKEIENFMGEDSIVHTRMYGAGFTAKLEYAVSTFEDQVWLSPNVRILKDHHGKCFWINCEAYNEVFGKEG